MTGQMRVVRRATQLIGQNHGPCDFDQPHTGTISATYSLPFGRGKTFLSSSPTLVNATLGNWELSGVATIKSGLPFTPTISQDRANTGAGGQRPEVVGAPSAANQVSCWFYTSSNPSCISLNPNLRNAFLMPAQYTYGDGGRNILRSDRLLQLDVALMKEFPIHETTRLQFRAEFFNVFNHPVFSVPVTNIDLPSGGQVSSTLNSDRILEFAMKFFF